MRKKWLTIVLCTLLQATFSFSLYHDSEDRKSLMERPKSHCFSCASFVYLPLWSQLMHHYYPPKNFTDRCWQPDSGIGLVPCSSACFTLVERIDDVSEQHGVIRGCMDRLLLFGLDDDVRNILSAYENQRVCRHTDRKLLRLFPLSGQTDVTFCSCNGDFCNEHDMLRELSSSNSFQIHSVLLLVATWILILF
ncbi:Homolog of Odr-2 (Two) [Caenorhabditis elegans]|uniref:Homolog of Odr-2 (Two) n=2 Tax=Caenorhabditis elegans TaxID=6239 RepID=Q8T3D0_CAEEL|nr:Homolog of Odr-2 (Two) [Caenorhabditis elegans]CCD65221.1 Homolog of Odr-2 (Two) [Caenorhabditis elegans]|eukprot:NP_741180.1 Homolog of Odr-2 (Two) [Caenorhabditis elegans]